MMGDRSALARSAMSTSSNGQRGTGSSFSAGAPRMGSGEALKAISGQLLGKDASVHGSRHGSVHGSVHGSKHGSR